MMYRRAAAVGCATEAARSPSLRSQLQASMKYRWTVRKLWHRTATAASERPRSGPTTLNATVRFAFAVSIQRTAVGGWGFCSSGADRVRRQRGSTPRELSGDSVHATHWRSLTSFGTLWYGGVLRSLQLPHWRNDQRPLPVTRRGAECEWRETGVFGTASGDAAHLNKPVLQHPRHGFGMRRARTRVGRRGRGADVRQ